MAQGSIITNAITGILKRYSKKLAKNGVPELPKAELIKMNNSADDCFNVGFAMCEVMPDIKSKTYWMAGYKPNNRAKGVRDPLTASAMWLDCKDDNGIVLVCVDCIGLTGHDVNLIRESLNDFTKETGCKNISISCSHTHAGIDTVGYWGRLWKTGKTKDYMDKLFTSIKDVCIEAYKNRKEGKLFIGSTRVPEVAGTGRHESAANDVLTRLRFVPNDGTTETWLLNLGVHPNTLGKDNNHISADYPYYMRKRINETVKTNVMFNVNAICGVSPEGMLSPDRKERTEICGIKVGEAALKIDNDKQLSSEISVMKQDMYIPIDNEMLAFLVWMGQCTCDRAYCEKGKLGLALRSELTYLKIGEQQILMIPGEAMPEFAYGGYRDAETSTTGKGPEINPKALVEVADDPNLLIFGVTNDMSGYMIPPNDFVLHEKRPYLSRGKNRFGDDHYHETNSLGYLVTETISNTFADMIDRIK